MYFCSVFVKIWFLQNPPIIYTHPVYCCYVDALSFSVTPRLPTHCRCRELLLDVNRIDNTHILGRNPSGLGIGPSQRPLPENTQHSQETDIHAHVGIRTRIPGRRCQIAIPHIGDGLRMSLHARYLPSFLLVRVVASISIRIPTYRGCILSLSSRIVILLRSNHS